ncbi:CheA signal transduction histidine kinase [Haloterrigena turkmenica DSM 5511]|uniref:Chemotaxis protein CheA n=1 Tax=Haloterrigena turkmenica (strain ATCC 51198 / DSM 5511 / JCM 9101 / NCIMB 13204 / VKM B-1734 / 4k) TaxID=543526 RepID=D2RYF1_HALTV|nr:chemotaxis protein CheA [Haloterrigena turkmenica]ADB59852.1 CheA signal transduction histidine kinase [Haloterrigena turkmenica DSM 5511]
MTDYLTDFVQESEERITELNNALLTLERDPTDDEAMENIFRVAHTLKGNCGAMGLEPASDLAHAIEDLLDAVRQGGLEVTPELMDVVFDAVDELETMIDEVAADGEIETDPSATIAALREQLEDGGGPAAITTPSTDEIDAVTKRFDPPADDEHRAYLVRLVIADRDGVNSGKLVVDALIDAFDLIGTQPPRDEIEAGEYRGTFDAVFGSAVGKSAITSGLEPVEEVADFELVDISDRFDARSDDSEAATEPGDEISTEDAADLEVDDLLDEFNEFDNLDEMVEDVDDDELEAFEEMGEAGSFDDLLDDDDLEVDGELGEPATDPIDGDADDAASDADVTEQATGDASADAEADDVDDANAVFNELKDEVEMVGFDELQDELEELEFDEFDNDDEVDMDELLGEDAADDDTFLAGPEPTDDAVDDILVDAVDEDEPATDAVTDDELDELLADDEEAPADAVTDEEVDDLLAGGDDPADAVTDDDLDDLFAGDEEASADAATDDDFDDLFADDDAADEPTDDEERTAVEPSEPDSASADEIVAEATSEPESAADVETEPVLEDDADVDEPVTGDADVEAAAETEPATETASAVEPESPAVDTETQTDVVDDDLESSTVAESDPVGTEEDAALQDEDEPAVDDPSTLLESDDAIEAASEPGDDSDALEVESETDSTDLETTDTAAEADSRDGESIEAGTELKDPTDDGDETLDDDATAVGSGSDGQTADDAESEFDDGLETSFEDEFDSPASADDSSDDPFAAGEDDPFADDSFADDSFADDSFADEDPFATDTTDDSFGDADAFADDDSFADDSFDTEFESSDDGFDDVTADADAESVDDFDETFGDEGGETSTDASAETPSFDDAAGADASDESAEEVVRRIEEPTLENPDLTVPESTDRPDADQQTDEIQSVRVDIEQIDSLLTLVEGLVTSRVRLRHTATESEATDALEAELDDLEDLTTDLQETVMDIRLVPLQTVANRLPRVVRDIARDQDKEVTFEITGEDVELDRSILDRIGDPLIHLVRNAVDHGIEPPEEREAADKPREGSVEVHADRSRDRVQITVEDDGNGLDPDRLRDEAVEAGVHTADEVAELSDDEAYDLIFHPGLSTADEVTDVSGRGVGMDVVKRTIEDLDGTVSIDSEAGEGTTVTMTLPVSVAIDDILFIESGGEEFGVPTKAVQDIEPAATLETVDGQRVLTDGDDTYSVIELDDVLETPRAGANGDGMVVRIRDDVRSVAIHCDHVYGQQEVVVKPFEGFMSDIPGLSGATVRGRGEVVNILDVTTL